MMYPFMTLDDNTEVVHSEMLPDHRVKVYFEKPDAKDCFHSAVCYLPDYKWEEIHGFTPAEIARYQELMEARSAEVVAKWTSFLAKRTTSAEILSHSITPPKTARALRYSIRRRRGKQNSTA